jgi:hypothetical protein
LPSTDGPSSDLTMVSSKQTKINFGSNQNKPKQDLFRVCFVKPKTISFGLFQCFEPITKQPKQTELLRNKPKFSEKYPNIPNILLLGWAFCENRKNRKNPKFSVKNSKICSLSNSFSWYSVCFGSIETSKLSVLV